MISRETNQKHLTFHSNTNRISLPSKYIYPLGWGKSDNISIERISVLASLKKNKIYSKPKIFSIGYEGKNIDNFIEILKNNKISELVDLRQNAFSWNKQFSRNLLGELAQYDIEYVNFPRLGAPSELRVEIKKNGNPDKFFSEYLKLLNKNIPYLNILDMISRQKNTAMMCMEADYNKCHRKIIGMKLEERGYDVIQL